MTYDVDLSDRVRDLVESERGLTEKRMFGGLAFLVDGRMAVATSSQGGLLVRVDPAETDSLTAEPHVGPFVMRGRPLTGWLRVDAAAVTDDGELERWVGRGVDRARSLRDA